MNAKTWSPRATEIDRRWYVIDAEGQTLGRLRSEEHTSELQSH